MRILVTGAAGQVGSELCRRAQPHEVVALTRADCDLTRLAAVRAAVRAARPQVIVNAAAYTAVDRAEQEPDLAYRLNGEVPGVLADEARELGALLIHYSTDYVFDGTKPGPYVESDITAPLNTYGASKLAGEEAVAQSGAQALVLRTTWVYASHGRNFLLTMLRLGEEREELRIVMDQFGAPTPAGEIAAATLRLIERYRAAADSLPAGLYHMTAGGSTSWHGMAEAIFSRAGWLARRPRLLAIPSGEFPTPARRPQNSVLSNDRFAAAFGFRLPEWSQGLDQVLAELAPLPQPVQQRGAGPR